MKEVMQGERERDIILPVRPLQGIKVRSLSLKPACLFRKAESLSLMSRNRDSWFIKHTIAFESQFETLDPRKAFDAFFFNDVICSYTQNKFFYNHICII